MTLPYPIAASQVDKKSPIDEQLMQAIKADLEELDSRTIAATSSVDFRLNGRLNPRYNSNDSSTMPRKHRFDGALISKDSLFQSCKITVEDGGAGGTVEVDVRRYTKPNALITSVVPLFRASIQSIARVGSSINTQSIARATPQISTQSIAKYKTQLNIQSIINLGLEDGTTLYYYRVNLDAAADSEYVGASVKLASTTGATFDGNFTVIAVGEDGGNNVIISSASNLTTQSSAAGTLDANLWKYTYTNPVNSHFAAGEVVTMASHSNAANDGAFTIFAINQGGNNIIVTNTSGVAQGGAAGTADCNRWTFTFSSAPSSTDYVVGESVLTQSHSSGGNNGTLPIMAVNSGGNNLILYNASGVVQGGAAGTVDTCRWVYSYSSDPSADVSAGDNIIHVSTTSGNNAGTFAVKEVNRSAGTNLVVYNTAGVAQGGAVGTSATEKKKVSFGANQADIIVGSRIRIVNNTLITEDDYEVFERNRGGGSNYNAVIKTTGTDTLAQPQGRVALESKSLFTTRPSLTIPPSTLNWSGTHCLVSSNAVLDVAQAEVDAGTLVMADLMSAPLFSKNLTVQLY